MQALNIGANPAVSFLVNKKFTWLRHGVFALILAIVYNLLDPEEIRKFAELYNTPYTILYFGFIIQYIFSLGLIYFNIYFLYPRFFLRGQVNKYFAGVLVAGAIFFLVAFFIHKSYVTQYGAKEEKGIDFSFSSFINVTLFPIIFLLATTGYKIFKQWIADQNKFAEMQKEKLITELQQLKSQVNPHFLFNTLNNLNVLIGTNPTKASEIVLGLSDVLRYQIYDSQHELVLLSKDIEIIKEFLEIEKIRRDNLEYKIHAAPNIASLRVPPLLFTNFVDNSIKHSISRAKSSINISFYTEDEYLYFNISNTKPSVSIEKIQGGLGLVNIKKRLDLLYGDKHTLQIRDEENTYTVTLKIPV
ncbi:MAG: hypothetical protein RL660_2294 [Bacteroidota bacterium]|jgi:sensor histidine kinase YesM